ncbi:30S ribosomal protein S15 [Candidatus Woesearchaeota archaeon]|nr:30S ribosomal protein S15 [Candidatus Woesearchaeota archaeon]
MSRMHSRKKGKSASTKPSEKKKPGWLRYTAKEVELLIGKIAKEVKNPSQIGLYLRDNYGIPDVKTITGKKINQILKEKNLLGEIPEDLQALLRKSVDIRKHLEENHKDMPAKRGLQLTESKILRLVKYYKKTNKLPADWKYDPSKARMFIE